jgi:hypothetical protein
MYKIYLWFENSHVSYKSNLVPQPGDIFSLLEFPDVAAATYIVDRRCINPRVADLITIILKPH